MPVFRVEKNSNYTTMCNYHLRDQGLSLKGKGLLSMLLSLPDTWNYSVGIIFDYAGWRRWSAYGSEGAGASWVSGKEPAA